MGKGEFVYLTGPSGAGKSTLLRMLLASERPDSGRVLIQGREVSRLKRSSIPYLRRNIGVVFQDFKLISSRTVADNVALALEVLSTPPQDVKRKVSAALAQVGLVHRMGARPEELSGGEQQRVAVARAIVNEASILLADEPTGNLDADRSAEILELLQQVHLRGTTILMATHDRTLLERFPNRRIQLERGRVVADHARGSQAARGGS